MKRSELKRSTGLSQRGKGGACPPKPWNELDTEERAVVLGLGQATTPRRKNSRRHRRLQLQGPKWRRRTFDEHGALCWVTGEPATQAHHVIPMQKLAFLLCPVWREQGMDFKQVEARLREVCRDVRNAMPLATDPHMNHHNRSPAIGRDVLAPCHFEFAAEHNLTWLLEKTYPEYPGVQA